MADREHDASEPKPDAASASSASPPSSRRGSALEDAAAGPSFNAVDLTDRSNVVVERSLMTRSAPMPPTFNTLGGGLEAFGAGIPPPLTFAQAKKASMIKKPESASAPSASVRVDRTKYVGVLPRELPPPPFRLERHTHFHVKLESVLRVCATVGRKLCQLDTDFEFKHDKCKWKVEYRREGFASQRVALNIVLFKTSKELVLEVQRREGDIAALMALYAELKSFFKSSQLLVDNAPTGTTTGVKRPAPKPLSPSAAAPSPAGIRDGISALRGLLDSKFADAQMQGVLGAISMSANGHDATRTGMAALVPKLVALGQSKHAGVSRLVGVALAQLCDHPECRQALVASSGWQFLVDCAAGGDDVLPEVQRESLRVVESLCPLYHDELAKSASAARVLALVEDWQRIEDPRLRKHACGAHRALKDAGVIA